MAPWLQPESSWTRVDSQLFSPKSRGRLGPRVGACGSNQQPEREPEREREPINWFQGLGGGASDFTAHSGPKLNRGEAYFSLMGPSLMGPSLMGPSLFQLNGAKLNGAKLNGAKLISA